TLAVLAPSAIVTVVIVVVSRLLRNEPLGADDDRFTTRAPDVCGTLLPARRWIVMTCDESVAPTVCGADVKVSTGLLTTESLTVTVISFVACVTPSETATRNR